VETAVETKMRNGILRSRQIVAFVATTTPTGAKNFYAETLGLRLVSEDAFALVFDAGGTMLRVAIVQELRPAAYTVLGWIVPDISHAIRDLERQGISFQRFDGLQQDDHGVWAAPGGARVAWFKDPDGNTLSLTEFGNPSRGRLKPARPRSSKARPTGVRLSRKR
jgi:catechol 2,3-dioxygenase-like lactoylglutathione lyase family enzyme